MRADSWILHELPELLVSDWYNYNIYSEFDLQVTAYFWLRKHFEKCSSIKWIVRAQPVIKLKTGNIVKPDIAIYRNTVLYDIIELKCQLGRLNFRAFAKDFKNLRKLKDEMELRHAYILVLYDYGRNLELPSSYKENWMKNYLTFIGANVRLDTNKRQRYGYSNFRRNWDIYWG
ncbi:MAG: hypothetical protein WBB67_05860 [bacterium]